MTPDETPGEARPAAPSPQAGSDSPSPAARPVVPPPAPAAGGPAARLPPIRPQDVPGAPDFVVPVDTQGAIAADVVCRKCAYNLRGLRDDGRCPECGSPVGLSTHGDLLRFADPDWVETLARGLTFILWGILVGLIATVVGEVLSTVVHPSIGGLVGLVGGLLGYCGAWLLTERDPSGLGEDRYGAARRIVRVALLIGLFGNVVSVAFAPSPAAGLPVPMALLLLVAGMVYVAGEFAKYFYLEKLALRIPDRQLADKAKFLRWALTACYAAFAVGGVAVAIAITAAAPGAGFGAAAGGALIGVTCVALVCLVVFSIMAIMLQYRMRNVVREHALFARDAWRRAAAVQGAEPPLTARPGS